MRKITTKIFIVGLILVHSIANAQFKEGESFLDGGFSLNLYDSKSKNASTEATTYRHAIYLSVGKFKSSTRAVGWSLSHELATQKLDNYAFDPKSLQKLSFGVSRFWEFYKPLSDKLALYLRQDAGVLYTLGNNFEIIDNALARETHDNTFSLNLGVGAGVAWRVAPKWAIYGGFAFANPLYLSYSFGNIVDRTNPRLDGTYNQANTSGFAYRFSPELSSGSISLGFRYFY